MKATLTIIISSYNRCELLQKNVNKMLKCESEDVEFIISDNASDDGTWEWMKTISDRRVRIMRNEKNYGFENFWLVSAYVQSAYFMFINDRDYIRPDKIDFFCCLLKKLEVCDFISNEKGNYNIGYYSWKDAINIYFQSRHPGTLIYNTEFANCVIDKKVIRAYLDEGRAEKANNYLVFQILLNVTKVFLYQKNPVNQPLNRERITKVRKEYYSAPYISLEYRSKEYDDWILAGLVHLGESRLKEIMLAIYRDSVMTVTWEYYFSMKIPGFPKRIDYEDHSADEWVKNGFLFYWHVLRNKNFKKFHLTKEITDITVQNYKDTIRKVMEWV